MSIFWGKKERFEFAKVGSLLSWDPPAVPAIYAITYKGNPLKPKSHAILFVGQADDLSLRAQELNGDVIDAWRSCGNDISELCVFIRIMPGSTIGERFKIQEQLVSEYAPQCNR